MQVSQTSLPGVLLLEPAVFGDSRGHFFEAWNARTFAEIDGLDVGFVQDNQSRSRRGVLRGIHYQLPHPQGKLVRCTAGAIWDVAVDLRRSSPTFKQWFGLELNADDHRQLWIPEGFGHGFLTLTETADVQYKTTDYFVAEADRAIAWNDPDLAIDWPLKGDPRVSDKDLRAPQLGGAVLYE